MFVVFCLLRNENMNMRGRDDAHPWSASSYEKPKNKRARGAQKKRINK